MKENTQKRCCDGCLVSKSCLTLAVPRTVAHQAPPSMGFPRQDYWFGLSFPSPGDLSDLGIELTSSALAGRFSTREPPRSPYRGTVWDKNRGGIIIGHEQDYLIFSVEISRKIMYWAILFESTCNFSVLQLPTA